MGAPPSAFGLGGDFSGTSRQRGLGGGTRNPSLRKWFSPAGATDFSPALQRRV